jgi:AbrB family looped-hinge helix DNA binding protein
MTNQVVIDRSGRVVIPKEIRARLGLSPGTRLVIEAHNEGEIMLRPMREEPRLVDKDGVLVVQALAVGDLEGAERREREARLGDLLRRASL